MKVLDAVILLVLGGSMAGQDQPAVAEPKPAQDEKLREELLDRVENDQVARKAIDELIRRKEVALDNPAIKKMMEIDRQNMAWLKVIVEKHGWPGKSLVGEEGAHSAWLLVQHADHDVVALVRGWAKSSVTASRQVSGARYANPEGHIAHVGRRAQRNARHDLTPGTERHPSRVAVVRKRA